MNWNLIGKALCGVVCTNLCLSALSAQAQIDEAAQLDEIVVTTTRAEAPRKDNIGNISILTPAQIETAYPSDLLNKATGVLIHRGNGQDHLTAIRSPVLVGGAGAGSFLYMQDGISLRAPGFSNINGLLDTASEFAQRVEITRGPGSALYGSNAVHGLVNVISRPIADERETTIRYGSYGRYNFTALQSEAENDFRIGVSFSGEREGYRANSGYHQQKLQAQFGNWAILASNLNQETAGFLPAFDHATARQNNDADAYRDAQGTLISYRFTHMLANGVEFALTPYLRNQDLEFRLHFLPGKALENNEHRSLGLQSKFTQTGENDRLIYGLDIDYTRGSLNETQTNPDAGFGSPAPYQQGVHYHYDVNAYVLAPFVHYENQLSERLRFVAGMRYEITRYDYKNKTDTGLQGRLYRPADRKDNFSDLSPKLGLLYDLAGGKLFTNLARAARAPQTTDLYRLRQRGDTPPNQAQTDSETLDSFEIGYRGGGDRLIYEIAAYIMQKKNYHFRDGNDFYETNGRTKHRGIELDLSWQAAAQIKFSGGMSYAVHEYDFTRNVAGANRLESITAGDDIDSAPRRLAHIAAQWMPRQAVSLTLSGRYIGSYFMDAANTTKYDGHSLFHLAGQYRLAGGTILLGQIRNLFDREYATRADKWFGRNRYFPGEERHFYIGVKRRF